MAADPTEKWKARAEELHRHVRLLSSVQQGTDAIIAALAEAAADEREICAQLADSVSSGYAVGATIAAAIRAREQKP